MNIIIELKKEIWCNGTLKETYEKDFKDSGFLFDEEAEAIYYEAEIPFMPIEGQRIGTKFGICIVDYALYEIDTTETNYLDRTKIVVRYE